RTGRRAASADRLANCSAIGRLTTALLLKRGRELWMMEISPGFEAARAPDPFLGAKPSPPKLGAHKPHHVIEADLADRLFSAIDPRITGHFWPELGSDVGQPAVDSDRALQVAAGGRRSNSLDGGVEGLVSQGAC